MWAAFGVWLAGLRALAGKGTEASAGRANVSGLEGGAATERWGLCVIRVIIKGVISVRERCRTGILINVSDLDTADSDRLDKHCSNLRGDTVLTRKDFTRHA